MRSEEMFRIISSLLLGALLCIGDFSIKFFYNHGYVTNSLVPLPVTMSPLFPFIFICWAFSIYFTLKYTGLIKSQSKHKTNLQ
jgi:hypothetical protein